MGGRREVSIIFYRPVSRSDLKQERSFFRGSVSSFLQLVVANPYTGWPPLMLDVIFVGNFPQPPLNHSREKE